MTVREPIGDLYRELRVSPEATREQLASAFRLRAKTLHPDMNPGDAEAAEQFKTLGRAYQVLSDPEARARYDAGRLLAVTAPAAFPAGPVVSVAPHFQLTRKAARWMVLGGVVLIVLGLGSAAWVISLQRDDADLRDRGVAATAVVVAAPGGRVLEFTTRDGQAVRTREDGKTGEVQPSVGSRVAIHYDRNDPTRVVTDESHTGRDVTLWIVAVKFVVGGVLLIGFGLRRLRRAA